MAKSSIIKNPAINPNIAAISGEFMLNVLVAEYKPLKPRQLYNKPIMIKIFVCMSKTTFSRKSVTEITMNRE